MNVSLAQPNSRSALQYIAQKIFSTEAHAGHIRELADVLAQITGVSAQDDPCSWESIVLDTGVAISPNQAARCLLEVLRSQRFMQGVAQAVEDKLADSDQVDILYAGTGPYGLLILPYLAVYRSSRIKVTLLDIHEKNITAVNQLLDVLQLRERVDCVAQADATQWQPPKGQQFDVILSETMNTFLRREPQVWIFSHLQQYLKPDGILIPEKIHLRAWLVFSGKPEAPDFLLGDLFVLDRHRAQRLQQGDLSSLSGDIAVPDSCPQHNCLKLTTDIQIYENYSLGEKESSLNMPIYRRDLALLAGGKIQFFYRQSPFPEFAFELPRVPFDGRLPEFDEAGSLGIFHLKRIWKKSRLSHSQRLDKAISDAEWDLDLMVYGELDLQLALAIRMVFQSATFEEFEQWLLAANDGFIEPARIARLNQRITAFVLLHEPQC